MTDINKTSQAALGSKFFALQMEENKLERLQLQIAGLDALCDQLRARIAELEALCDETYVAKGADAYSHAVECMEEWRERRMREGKPPLYAAGLCDHLSLVRNYVESLEGERDALRARIAELERQPIRWRPISEAPVNREVIVWTPDDGIASARLDGGEWVGLIPAGQGFADPRPTHFAEIVGPEGES